jgi:excinuclease ABC subunit A
VHKPIKNLTRQEFDMLWKGSHPNAPSVMAFFDMVGQNLYKIHYRILQAKYRGKTTCPMCNGSRLRPEATYVKINQKWIGEVANWQVNDLLHWIRHLELTDYERQIAARLLLEIEQRLQTLVDVGLEYLTLMRLANTLSGGETQRIHLTRFLGSNLTDSLYILDEPSIGLHQKDTAKLIGVLKNLRDLGNTVIVVEHDEMMMRAADYIIDMGPMAAQLGGEVMAAGDWETIINHPDSLTAKYLSHQLTVGTGPRHTIRKDFIELTDCRHHNLKGIDVKIPLGCMTVVMGVSGSGKSTLIADILYPAMLNSTLHETNKTGLFGELKGATNKIDRVELIDQNPIGKSSRSNPVTYIKAWDEIRQVLTKTSVAKMNGYLPKHFSFNAEGGRCENCKGEGTVVVEMQFLADVQLQCEVCKGQRFKDEILDVKYKDHNVYQILELTVDEAIVLFEEEKRVVEALLPLQKVGLGYIKLGQSSSNLSGGEAQRVKLATFLSKAELRSKDRVMFIFDEPTTGLHFHDINKLLNSLNQLIELGHTFVIIEHNLDVVKCADWVIELGPSGGANGGYLLYQGPYDGLQTATQSVTAPFLN